MRAAPALLQVATIGRTHQAFLLPFVRHFQSLGWRVDGAAAGISRIPGCVEAYDRVFDLEWSRNPLDPRNLMQASAYLRRIVDRGGYDLVHVHTPVAAFATRWALRSLRRTRSLHVIYTAHGFHFHSRSTKWGNAVFRKLEQLAGRWTDTLIVINREDEAAARKYGLAAIDRIEYVPGIGIDSKAYRPAAVGVEEVERVRSELELDSDTPMFLMVAEFQSGKRHRDAVDALYRIAHRPAHLAFAGTGPTMVKVIAQVRRLGLERRVHFLGYRSDVAALMRASTATIMPSEREGLNRSVMESLALEVPVIGTNARGVADLLAGGAGLVVPVGAVDSLAQAMTWVLDNQEQAREMARVGRQRIVAQCDIRRVMTQYERIYLRLLAGG